MVERESGKHSQIRLNFCLAPCGFFGDVFCCFFPQLGLGRSCMYVLAYKLSRLGLVFMKNLITQQLSSWSSMFWSCCCCC
jgi:hypothetical protein